ncbi:MAG: serine/threonine protein kinase, partial [Sciscionella sp.]|nr:serine/threonine protein kinase [Sciscionella sp.]
MRLPSLLEYQRAVQIPAEAFKTVPLLRTGRPILTPQGMPSVASGGFAATFKIEAATGDRYAVRCFHKQGQHDRNLPERYRHIAAFVAAHPDHEFLIDVVYQDDGITVGSNPFPTVRMQWAVGDTLGIWLEDWAEDPHRDPAAIDTVRTNIAHAVSALQQAGAAHGDLQHGNILVAPDLSIRLIDYDGMYLETFTRMPHLEAIEQGHRNYQHPGRGARYDTSIDTFSAAVIDLSLRALQHRPRLWEDYGGTGENLILGADDFCDPANSSAFAELVSIPEIAEQARRLQTACQVDYNQVAAALAGQAVTIPAATIFTAARGSDVFRAEQIDELRRLQGQTVTVFGTIQFASVTKGRGGRDVALLNLGNYENGDFTIVGYDTVAESLFAAFGTTTRNHKRVLRKLHGWRVAITGMIVLYEYRGMLVPQIELVRAGLLRNLTADKIAELTKAAA